MKIRKTLALTLVISIALLSVCSLAYAAGVTKSIEVTYTNPSIFVDGYLIETKDVTGKKVEPFVYEGTTYLPVRAISEALGKTVDWDSAANRIDIGNPSTEEIREITVGTAAEFIAAIGPNTHILMKEGVYNLSSVKPDNSLKSNVFWDTVYDGSELCLYRIQNLTIEGIGKTPSEIVVEPRYAFVLNFMQCTNVNMKNITAGHTDAGYCAGGVFAFSNSTDITLDSVNMYGCGTEGLNLYNVNNMEVKNSSIYECTYAIMTVDASKNIKFEDCVFRDNEGFSMVNLYATSGFTIKNCEFKNNNAQLDMFSSTSSTDVNISGCTFTGNKAKSLQGSSGIPGLTGNNTFTKNEF